MTLAERLSRVRAAPPSAASGSARHEHDDALAEVAALCRREGWALAAWDVDRGLDLRRARRRPPPSRRRRPAGRRPRAGRPGHARRHRRCWCSATSTASSARPRSSRPWTPGRRRQARPAPSSSSWRRSSRSPSSSRSSSSSSSTTCPAATSCGPIARGVATEPGELPGGDGLDAVLDAAAGLTRAEAENAFSLSLVRHGRLAPDVLWEIKAGALKKRGLLTLHRGGGSFADLGGLEALKAFCRRALRPGRPAGVPRHGACSCSGRRARARAPSRGLPFNG